MPLPLADVPLGSSLPAGELVALVEAAHLMVDAGCLLLDADDQLIDDISDALVPSGSSVKRGVYNTVHGTASLNLERELQWGWQRLQPFLLLSADGVSWWKWPLGVFLPSTPSVPLHQSPPVFQVDCFDKLDVLNTAHGEVFALEAGQAIIPAVEALIAAAGESKVRIDQSAVAEVAGSTRLFELEQTTLTIVNDALAMLGYRGLWVDRDGWCRSGPYVSPSSLSTVWAYDTSSSTSVGEQRDLTADFYRAANVVVGVNNDATNDIPTLGAGLHTITNFHDGPTSVSGRGGRMIRRVVSGSFASQAALESACDAAMDAEKRVARHVDLTVSPNPVHGHFDVVSFTDPAGAIDERFLVTDWELPLDGSDMSLSMRAV